MILTFVSGCTHIPGERTSKSSDLFTIEAAHRISEQVKSPENRVWLLHEIANQCFALGNSSNGKEILDEALELTISTLDKSEHVIMSVNLGSLVTCYLENGFFDSAIRAANTVPHQSSKRSDLASIAVVYYEKGLVDKADSIVKDIIQHNDENDYGFLRTMSWYYTRTNQRENAIEYLDKCKKYICTRYGFGIDAAVTVNRFLHWNLVDDAEKTIECIDETNHDLVSAMCSVAVHYFDKGKLDKANEILSRVSLIGEKVFDEEPIQYDTGDMTFQSLIYAQAYLGYFETAETYAEHMHREHYRSGSYTWIGERYIENDRFLDAVRILSKIKRETETVWLMQKIIEKYNGRKHLDEMLAVVNAMSNPLHKTRCLAILAEGYKRAELNSIAYDLISQAVTNIPEIYYVGDRSWALCEISDELQRSGLRLNRECMKIINEMIKLDSKIRSDIKDEAQN